MSEAVPLHTTTPPGAFLAGGGKMGALMRAHDWSTSPVGPPETWPQSLRSVVGLMLANRHLMFVAWGPELAFLYNDGYAPVFGARHPWALGRPFREVWPEIWDDIEPLIQTALGGEATWSENLHLVMQRNGYPEDCWFTFSYSPVRDESGRIAGLFCAGTETTQQVLAERRLQAEHARLAQLFEQAPGFIAMLEGPEHRFALTNPAYQKLIGNREAVGRTVAEVLPDAVRQGYVDLLDTVYRTGEPYRSVRSPFAMQARPGGPVADLVLDFAYQPVRDGSGAITGIFVQGHDITDAERAEQALRESEERYRTLFGAMDEGFCIIEFIDGPDGPLSDYIHVEANAAYERHAGIANVVGQKVRTMVPDEAAGWVEIYGRVLATGEPVRFQRELVATGKYLELSAHRIGPASQRQVAVLFQDITPRKQAEEALRALNATLESQVQERTAELMRAEEALRQAQKMEAVGQLTGGLAHDFNNLLAGISGALELIQSRLDQGRTRDIQTYVEAAQGAARRAASLTHRLLAFSRRQTLAPKPTDIKQLVTGMEDLINRTVGPAIEVDVVNAIGLWPSLIDPSQLENAILNLCINARDAMPDGGTITIETANRWVDRRMAAERGLEPGQYISVCVSDTGAGMTRDVIDKAFDPFFTTKPIGMGTGLGLSMIYGFAKQSGGAASICSEPGRGAMVCIYLPRWHGEAEAERPADSTGAPRARAGETVLVIDDEPIVRMLVTEVLGDLGYTAIEAVDGAAGLKVLNSDARIDLLVTDVGLPGMNGRQVADAARALRPGLKVLFITGYAENAVLSHGDLEPGMHVMTKPFAMEALASRIRALIAS